MTGQPVPFMLAFAEIEIVFQIVGLLDLLKGINYFVLLFLISWKVKSLIAVLVDVSPGPVLIDMITVGDIKTAIIVFWVISAILPGPAIVSCHF